MSRRLLLIATLALALLGGLLFAYHLAIQRLNGALLQALGPRASIGSIELGFTGLTVRGLRVAAGPGWPDEEELRADAVHVRPDLASALGGAWRVQLIEIDNARIVLLRTRDGRLRVLPSMLEDRATNATPAAGSPGASPRVRIDHVVLRQAGIDLYDASLKLPKPHLVQLAHLEATINQLAVPSFDEPMDLHIQADFKGPTHDGRLSLDGQLTPATREAQLRAELHHADLLALQPYLLKVADGGIRRGSIDLTLDAKVHAQVLKAPGEVTLTGLELADRPGVLDKFAGLSRQAALAALKQHDKISMKFTLEGRLDDPSFSINDSLAKRFGVGLAQALGVSIEGVVEGVGRVFKGLIGR